MAKVDWSQFTPVAEPEAAGVDWSQFALAPDALDASVMKFKAAADAKANAEATDRTWGEFATDTGKSLTQGAIDATAGLGGFLYGAATGDHDNASSRFARGMNEVIGEGKSAKSKADTAAIQAAVDAAEGGFEKAAVGGWETLSNPSAMFDQLARSAPGMVAGGVVGRLAGKAMPVIGNTILRAAPDMASKAATFGLKVGQAGNVVGGAAATGTAALTQGSSVANDTYETAMKVPIEVYASVEGFKELAAEHGAEQAKEMMASDATTRAGVMGTLASVLSMKVIPGGGTMEKMLLPAAMRGEAGKIGSNFLTKPLTQGFSGGMGSKAGELLIGGTAKGIGEGFSEGLEEGSGAVAKALSVSPITGETPDLGTLAMEAAGQAAPLGFLMGKVGGLRDSSPPTPATPPAAPIAPTVESQPTTPVAPVVNKSAAVADPIAPMDDAALLAGVPLEEGEVDAAPTLEELTAKANESLQRQVDAGRIVLDAPTELSPPTTTAAPTAVIPTGTDPRSTLSTEMAALKERTNVAQAAQAEQAKLDAKTAEQKRLSEGDYRQASATPTPQSGAVPSPQLVTRMVERAKTTFAKNADLQSEQAYPERVLYGIINSTDVGPDLLSAARTELDRRRGNINQPTVSYTGQQSGTTSLGVAPAQGRAAGANGLKQPTNVQPTGSNPGGSATGAPALSNRAATGKQGVDNLPLAQSAPADVFEGVQKKVYQKKAVIIKRSQRPLSYQQQVVSKLAAMSGKTVTWIERASGAENAMPNGFVNSFEGEHYFMDADSTHPALEILMHEGVHALPNHIRSKLKAVVLKNVSATGKAAFLKRYGYDQESDTIKDEEVTAYVVQNVVKNPEFFQDLRKALGNKDFAELAKAIIGKIKNWFQNPDQFDAEFLGKNIANLQEVHDAAVQAYTQAMQEQGLTPDAAVVGGPAMANKAGSVEGFTPAPATKAEIRQAKSYEAENGILPYTSEGQLEVPIAFALKAQYGDKDLAKGRENHPLLGLPMNKDGTVTLYYPATNEVARQLAKDKVLRGATPTSTRIYLTNESSGPKVMETPGQMDQAQGGANVMLMIDPSYVHLAEEHEDGRKDFFVPIAEGSAFQRKMKMVKLFTVDGPREKALSKTATMSDIATGFTKGVESYMAMTAKEKTARHNKAKATLMAEHNVSTLLGENGKLQKTRVGDYGLRDGATDKSVASMGLGLASAQKINDKLSTCPQSARCESLCLGDTSGQNLLYGGDGQFRSGPRMSQYLKTEAMVLHPEDFAIKLAREIESFVKWAESENGYEMIADADGNKVQTPKQSYKPAIRLNVTSDFPPKVFEALIKAFPQVNFYDYTKLNSDAIADNHHLTYSSSGVIQKVDGKVIGKGEGLATGKGNVKSNWDAMVRKMERGFNVAMAFTSRNDIPKFLLDEKTGQKFEVWDGDNYDARFLDPARYGANGQRVGMIVGLTNKDKTGRPEGAATKYDGFFVDYNKERDGDTLVIQDQEALASGRKVIPIAKAATEPEVEVAFSNKAQRDLNQDIVLEIPLDNGKTAKLTVNAQAYITQLDARKSALEMVKECMA